MTPDLFVHLIFRFIHITSVILFLGGVVYARQVLAPTLDSLPEAYRPAAASRAQTGYRTTLYTLLLLIVGSGLYNFLTFSGPKHSRDYQMWFGFKMLLVLHILATAILWATSSPSDAAASAKSKRRLVSLSYFRADRGFHFQLPSLANAARTIAAAKPERMPSNGQHI